MRPECCDEISESKSNLRFDYESRCLILKDRSIEKAEVSQRKISREDLLKSEFE